MNDQPDLLEEYQPSSTKSKTLNLVLVLSLLFIAALNFALYYDLGKYYFDWMTLVLAILVPAAGSVLLYLKKSAGWFIAVVYYSFIAVAFLYAIGKWALGVLPYLPDNYIIARQDLKTD